MSDDPESVVTAAPKRGGWRSFVVRSFGCSVLSLFAGPFFELPLWLGVRGHEKVPTYGHQEVPTLAVT
jgi:hypothetical protein